MTLAFNLLEQMFQMALPTTQGQQLCQILLKSMHKCTTYGLGQDQFLTILSFDLQVWPWPSTYLNKCFKWDFYSSRKTTVSNVFEIHAQMLKLWPGQAHSVYDYFISFDL